MPCVRGSAERPTSFAARRASANSSGGPRSNRRRSRSRMTIDKSNGRVPRHSAWDTVLPRRLHDFHISRRDLMSARQVTYVGGKALIAVAVLWGLILAGCSTGSSPVATGKPPGEKAHVASNENSTGATEQD